MTDVKAIPVNDPNVYKRWADSLENTADKLSKVAENIAGKAPARLEKAGHHAKEAGWSLLDAGIGHPTAAVVHGVAGTIEGGKGVVNVGKGIGYASIGGLAYAARELYDGVRDLYVAALSTLAKGMNAMKNALERHLHRYDKVENIEKSILADPSGQEFAKRMFEKSGDSFKLAGNNLIDCLDNYGTAVLHLAVGVPASAVAAAIHMGTTLGNVGLAAAEGGAALGVKVAELGVRASKIAVQAAEHSEELLADSMGVARDALIAAANAAGRDQHEISPATVQKLDAAVAQLEQRLAAA